MAHRHLLMASLILGSALAVAACDVSLPKRDTASVPLSDNTQAVVEASGGTEGAVRDLRLENFEGARKGFETYVAAHPDDHRAWFGLAVCQENLKDYHKAMDSYAKANSLVGGEGKHEYVAGYLRMKDKIGDQK